MNIAARDVAHTPALDELIGTIRKIVCAGNDAGQTSRRVAEAVQPYLLRKDFLRPEDRQPNDKAYSRHTLHVEPDGSFSLVSLVWLPGQATAIHDHVSWCVVGVCAGEEFETVYEKENTGAEDVLRVTNHVVNPAGSVEALVPPGDIHKVENRGDELAVSLHIYGADINVLGSSIRRCYDLEVCGAAAATL